MFIGLGMAFGSGEMYDFHAQIGPEDLTETFSFCISNEEDSRY